MDRKYIDDHHVIARYLADQLSEDELAAFESYYVQHPEIVREMEAAARLKEGLRSLRDSGELDPLLQRSAAGRGVLRYALAASVAVATLAALFYFGTRAPLMGPDIAAISRPFQTLVRAGPAQDVLRYRSSESQADVEIVIASRPEAVELRVVPQKSRPQLRYRATLSSLSAEERVPVADSELISDDRGYVHVFLDSGRLEPGVYELRLSEPSTDAGDADDSYRINVRAQNE